MKLKKLLNCFIAIILLMNMCVILSSCSILERIMTSESSDVSDDSNSGEKYTKGILTEKTFESEFLNLKFEAQDDYVMATQEEIDKMVKFSGELLYTDKDKKMIDYAKATTVYEMFVQSVDGLPNANVLVEKVLKNMTIDQYIESIKKQISNITAMKFTIDEKISVATIAGQEYKKLNAKTEYDDVSMIQEYYVRKQNDRVIGIIVTYSEDKVDQKETLLNTFKTYQ